MTGWQTKPLGQLATFKGGGTPSKSQPSFWDGDVPWVSPKDMKFDQISTSRDSISMEAVAHSSANLIPTASILVVVRSGILARTIPVGLTTRELTVNQDIKAICPKASLDPKYLHYFMRSAEKELLKKVTRGATVHRLSTDDLKNLLVPLPPFPEQKRIVAILDEAFEGIDAAIANTQANIAAARELFESHLNKSFECKLKNLPELTLGQLCDFENGDRGKNYPNKSEYVSDGIPWINTGHINPDGSLAQDRMSYITETKFNSLGSGKIREGDLVYCLRGATIGKTAIVDPFTQGAIASSLMIIRPRNINRHFLYFYLISKHGKSEIRKYQNGAAQPNLGAKNVKQYSIRVPSAKEQKEVVSRIQSLSAQIAKLENSYGAKLNALHELKQSILAKAFRGELTQEEIAA